MPFVKLDTGILHSTLWFEREARELFITALLMAEPCEIKESVPQLKVDAIEPTGFTVPPGWYGFVKAAGIGIIRQSGMDRVTGLKALDALGSPDNESRSSEFEGRRLVRVNGGFIVLNYIKYRERDATTADRSRRWRQRQKELASQQSDSVTQRRDATATDTHRHQAEVEVEVEAEESKALDGKSSKGGKSCIGGETVKGTPSDLSEIEYARRIMAELRMPETPQTIHQVSAGIKAEAPNHSNLGETFDFLLPLAKAEIERAGMVTGFWFQDAKWRKKKKTEPKGITQVSGAELRRKAAKRLGEDK